MNSPFDPAGTVVDLIPRERRRFTAKIRVIFWGGLSVFSLLNRPNVPLGRRKVSVGAHTRRHYHSRLFLDPSIVFPPILSAHLAASSSC